MNKEQPKDYAEAIELFEETFEQVWRETPFFSKVVYYLQKFILLALAVAVVGGYLAGMTYGKFW